MWITLLWTAFDFTAPRLQPLFEALLLPKFLGPQISVTEPRLALCWRSWHRRRKQSESSGTKAQQAPHLLGVVSVRRGSAFRSATGHKDQSGTCTPLGKGHHRTVDTIFRNRHIHDNSRAPRAEGFQHVHLCHIALPALVSRPLSRQFAISNHTANNSCNSGTDSHIL